MHAIVVGDKDGYSESGWGEGLVLENGRVRDVLFLLRMSLDSDLPALAE